MPEIVVFLAVSLFIPGQSPKHYSWPMESADVCMHEARTVLDTKLPPGSAVVSGCVVHTPEGKSEGT